jgi:hypothetical protein
MKVISKIEDLWTSGKCLSIQIHCKVGHGEKYQHLIILWQRNGDAKNKKWEHMKLKMLTSSYVTSWKSQVAGLADFWRVGPQKCPGNAP